MKKLLALFLALVMLFSVATLFAGCEEDGGKKKSSSQKQDDDEEEEEDEVDENGDEEETEDPTQGEQGSQTFDDTDGNGPLLYKVTDENGNVIWLFGSIHVGREDYYPLPAYVVDAYESSDALAVEGDILAFENDLALQTEVLMSLMFTDGSTISSYLSSELYDASVAIMEEYNQYNILLDYFMPITWYQTINSLAITEAGGNVSLGIDRYFLKLAKEENKPILEVESAQIQYGMLAGFSMDLQVLMLETVVDSFYEFDQMEESLNSLMDLWYSGNEAKFAQYLAQESDIPEKYESYENFDALLEEYNNAMIVERNQYMTNYAVEALASGEEVFICVGAAHVVGEGAMAQNLRELGYTVEIIR